MRGADAAQRRLPGQPFGGASRSRSITMGREEIARPDLDSRRSGNYRRCMPPSWRRNQLAHFGERVTWLGDAEGEGTYSYVERFLSKSHYGLDPEHVADLERFAVAGRIAEASAWLSARIGDARVLVIFGKHDVCRMDGAFFVGNWQNMLAPSRDDAVILVEQGGGILFYWHEDELEFAQRRSV